MKNYTIAILITTFLRDNLLYNTLQTIVENYPKDSIVLIADQGYCSEEKQLTIDYYKSQIPLEFYQIPFDSGLSYARNFLVQKAHDMNIPYCLLMADNIQFIQPYNFQPFIKFLESDSKRGLVGFDLIGSKANWEFLMNVSSKGIQFSYPTKSIIYENIKFVKVDICRNIFLAKTNSLINLWDEELKLAEHELSFVEYKKREYEVFYTDYYSFQKKNNNSSDEYRSYRKRFDEYRQLLKQKLEIQTWIIYPRGYKNEKRNKIN